MTADPKPDSATADQLRKLADLARPCDCDHGCSHDLAYAEIDNMGGWKAIAMKLLDDADKLRAALAEARASFKSAHAVGFAAAIEAAGQVAEDWFYDPEEDDVTDVRLSIDIRALTPPDITAAAARVLLAAWPTDTSFDAAFAACATAYHGGDQMQDTMDRTLATVSAALRALAEVKP